MSNDQTIEHLNKALQMEMSVAHQYQLHAHVLKDWGLTKLAQQMRKEMQEELGHSDRFIERIMFLKGNPDIALQKPPHRAKNLVDMFKVDLSDEEDAIAFYTKAAKAADEAGDIGSRTLFEQIDLIERIGEQAYSAELVTFDESGDA